MRIASDTRHGVTIVSVESEVDDRATAFGPSWRTVVPPGGQVLLDLSHAATASSTSLRILLRMYRQANAVGGRVALVCGPSGVRQLISATGFADLLTVADSVEDAIAALEGKAGT